MEQDKEEDGFAHQVGKRPRKEPLFGGALQKMETGSDFAIGLISSPRWEQDTERKRRPSNDRVPGNKTEKKTVLSTPWEQDYGVLRSKLVFYSSSPVFDVSPFAMGRDSSSSWSPGATSHPIFLLIY